MVDNEGGGGSHDEPPNKVARKAVANKGMGGGDDIPCVPSSVGRGKQADAAVVVTDMAEGSRHPNDGPPCVKMESPAVADGVEEAARSMAAPGTQGDGVDDRSAQPPREALREATEPYPIFIGCYNFKGGVGKTTIAINLGITLRNLGHRTCYVDCDPQCNLSKFFHMSNVAANHGAEATPLGGELGDNGRQAQPGGDLPGSSELPRVRLDQLPEEMRLSIDVCKKGSYDAWGNVYEHTLKDILAEAFKNNAVGKFEVIEFAARKDGRGKPLYPNLPNGLFLIPGHLELGWMLEGKFHNARGNIHNLGEVDGFFALGGFRKALRDIGRKHGIKYMVCDLGPSMGITNEVLLASLDLIIPPFQPDLFSASSVHGLLASVVKRVIALKEEVKVCEEKQRRDKEARQPYAFHGGPTKLLPFLMVNLRLEGDAGHEQEIHTNAAFLELVTRLIQDKEIPPMVKDLVLHDAEGRKVVPFLNRVASLFDAAQTLGHPAMDLTPALLARRYGDQLPPGIMSELQHTREVFRWLANMVVAVSTN
eukprot:jgi/Mesvir1/29727/Mv26556-RA.2